MKCREIGYCVLFLCTIYYFYGQINWNNNVNLKGHYETQNTRAKSYLQQQNESWNKSKTLKSKIEQALSDNFVATLKENTERDVHMKLVEYNKHLRKEITVRQSVIENATVFDRNRTIDFRIEPEGLTLPKALSPKMYDKFIALLKYFQNLCKRHNITYIIADGNLLGSYFFHDFIPWDDDLDVTVRYKDRDKLVKAFLEPDFQTNYGLHTFHDYGNSINWYSMEYLNGSKPTPKIPSIPPRAPYKAFYHDLKTKLFPLDGSPAGEYPWKYPFLDIKFYLENKKEMWKADVVNPQTFTFPLSEFYPLHPRPFGKLWLMAPRNTRLFLKKKYAQFRCRTHDWNHASETPSKKVQEVKCSSLKGKYPHIIRQPKIRGNESGVEEAMWLGDRLLDVKFVNEPYYHTVNFYSLD